MALNEPVAVYLATDNEDAYFLHNLLEQAGIEAKVVGDRMMDVLGEVPFQSARPAVWVRKSDVERARPIVDGYQDRLIERAQEQEQGSQPAGNQSFCYHCGQSVAYGQSPCPACGKPLDWKGE